MTTPFKAKAKGVLVEVPEDAMYPIIDDAKFLVYAQGDYTAVQKLPPGDWQLVGTSDTMSEDDWKGIVDCYMYKGTMAHYLDYQQSNRFFGSATRSGHSLLPDPSKRYAVLILKGNK